MNLDPGQLNAGPQYFWTVLDDSESWLQVEQELRDAGFKLPLFQRWAWIECCNPPSSKLLVVRDAAYVLIGVAAVSMHPSRALPGYKLLRIHRFGDAMPKTLAAPMAAALRSYASAESRILRMSVELFSRSTLADIGSTFSNHCFTREPKPRSYHNTLLIDLRSDVNDIFAGFHKTARKNLSPTALAKSYSIPLTQPAFAARIAELHAEAMSRTGGSHNSFDARAAIQLSNLYPHLSRVAGLFQAGADPTPANLIGFAWGCMHGDCAQYYSAGTARLRDSNIAISYPLLWELILWARLEGAVDFDLGGITPSDPTHPLHGISTFKRFFSRSMQEVGDEWVFEPHPIRARVADLIGSFAQRFRKAKAKPIRQPKSTVGSRPEALSRAI